MPSEPSHRIYDHPASIDTPANDVASSLRHGSMSVSSHSFTQSHSDHPSSTLPKPSAGFRGHWQAGSLQAARHYSSPSVFRQQTGALLPDVPTTAPPPVRPDSPQWNEPWLPQADSPTSYHMSSPWESIHGDAMLGPSPFQVGSHKNAQVDGVEPHEHAAPAFRATMATARISHAKASYAPQQAKAQWAGQSVSSPPGVQSGGYSTEQSRYRPFVPGAAPVWDAPATYTTTCYGWST